MKIPKFVSKLLRELVFYRVIVMLYCFVIYLYDCIEKMDFFYSAFPECIVLCCILSNVLLPKKKRKENACNISKFNHYLSIDAPVNIFSAFFSRLCTTFANRSHYMHVSLPIRFTCHVCILSFYFHPYFNRISFLFFHLPSFQISLRSKD